MQTKLNLPWPFVPLDTAASGNAPESYTYEYDSLGRIIQSREDSGDETVLRIQ